jgi:hypothetical protein
MAAVPLDVLGQHPQLDAAARERPLGHVDRLGRVLQQVDHHLFDEDRVDAQDRQPRGHIVIEAHIAPAQLDARELDRFADHGRATSAGVRLGSLRFTKERMRWMIWPARCACFEVFSSAASRASESIVLPLDARHHAVAVVGDRGQRLVELVRHARRHFAHRDQAAGRHARLSACAAACSSASRRGVMSVAITNCASRPSTHVR